MKNLWKRGVLLLNFTFRIQIPNTDPDPAWQFESGSNRIWIRNTALKDGVKIKKIAYNEGQPSNIP